MSDAHFKDWVDAVATGIDGVGVVVVVAGLTLATGIFVVRAVRSDSFTVRYRDYRQNLGRAILLGLEFLVAADIIRTVAVSPTFRSAGVLALIILIRTFLSFTLQLEIDGRWPWQQRAGGGAP